MLIELNGLATFLVGFKLEGNQHLEELLNDKTILEEDICNFGVIRCVKIGKVNCGGYRILKY